jgi:hypothetical protein
VIFATAVAAKKATERVVANFIFANVVVEFQCFLISQVQIEEGSSATAEVIEEWRMLIVWTMGGTSDWWLVRGEDRRGVNKWERIEGEGWIYTVYEGREGKLPPTFR